MNKRKTKKKNELVRNAVKEEIKPLPTKKQIEKDYQHGISIAKKLITYLKPVWYLGKKKSTRRKVYK